MEDKYNPKDDELWNKGLSTGEAEEAGDFTGTGDIAYEYIEKSDLITRHPKDENEPKKTPGTIMYEPEYDKIPIGNTGSNKQKLPNI
jgi:hypothetical protein